MQAARRQNRLLVSHPIVDRLLQCSARPEAAVHFFTRLFDPSPQQRLTVLAREHPYIADIGRDLKAAARVPANILGDAPVHVTLSRISVLSICVLHLLSLPMDTS